jgi:hypothetical protein
LRSWLACWVGHVDDLGATATLTSIDVARGEVVEIDEEIEAKLDVVAVGQVRPAMALRIARRESVGKLAGVDVLEDRPGGRDLNHA